MIYTNKLEIIFTLLLSMFCLWVISEGYALSLGNLYEIGPGFLLFFNGLLMIIMCAISVASVIKKRENISPVFESGQGLIKVCLTIFIILVTGIFFETIGFVIMTAIFMIVLMRFVGKEKWLRLSIVTITTIILSYSVFSLLLKIQLPMGPFEF